MRAAIVLVPLIAAAGLAGCATYPGRASTTYAEELRQLEADCAARGGILTPIAGATGPRPANDYACEIRGGGSGRLD